MAQRSDEPPDTGKSGLFKRPPVVEPVRFAYVYEGPGNVRFPIVCDPLAGLNSSRGPVDEKGWPILRAADEE